ncbi:ATP-dependent DNA helicase [Rudanella lutea]|uniref:ATP-dependent DNA helicase n=1 Tax=Rudanella lutea TaxID=451374 RepID=UPI00035C58F0|nr:AAA family ATPase [Rudanella lutea]
MTIKQIENTWRLNFKKSPLITDGYFNPSIARQLYYGPDEDSDLPFKEGFLDFNDNYDISDIEKNIDSLLQYLHFIGITISKKSISDGIARGTTSYPNILKKAFYIFKHLADYDEELNIDDPFHDNMGDLVFFLRIEEGDNEQPKQLTLFDELELPDFYNKYIELPAGYENDKKAQKLFHLIENSGKSIFLTGKAGTGKSTFIHYFTKQTEKSVLLVAFTGIAAINIGGQTIHSFFRFPLKPLLPNDPDITIFKPFFQKRKILEQTDTIIIDEVSMLRSDILEGLDYSLRINGGNPNKIFGGKQLILVGDIFQLPPVIDNADEVESELFKIIYDSEYFFDSVAYKQLNPETFEFNKVHRQSNEEFISLLNKVRDCSIDNNGIDELNKRYNPSFTPKPEEFVITLTTNNYLAKSENVTKLNSLPYKSHFFKANITGDFKEDKYPTDPVLELRRNSQIMLVKNDSADKGRRWVNGTIAKIEFIDDDKIEIRLKNGSVHTLVKETWENREYQWDKKKGRITSKVVGTFEQYPIKLAWAITIHKSQGLTFDNVIVDLGSGAFVNGQLYTALSRCRTLEGLTLKRRIQKKDIIEDKRLIDFYNNKIRNSSIKLENEEGDLVDIVKNLNWVFLLDKFEFYNQLFSTHYHFTENELIKLHSILSIGRPYLTIDSGAIHCPTTFGLIYNNKIKWINHLKNLYYQEPRLLYAGGSTDEYSYNIEFDKLPLSINDEFEDIKSIARNQILSGYEYSDKEGYYDHLPDELDSSDKYYNEILTKTKFSDFELYNIVANNVFEFTGNAHFYSASIELLKNAIPDFSVINYYDKYKNSTQQAFGGNGG